MNIQVTTASPVPEAPPMPTTQSQNAGRYHGSVVTVTPVQISTEAEASGHNRTTADTHLSQPVEESSAHESVENYRTIMLGQVRRQDMQLQLTSCEPTSLQYDQPPPNESALSVPAYPQPTGDGRPALLENVLAELSLETVQPEDQQCLLTILPELQEQFCSTFKVEQYIEALYRLNILTREERQILESIHGTDKKNLYFLSLLFKQIATGNHTPYSHLVSLLRKSNNILAELIDTQKEKYYQFHPHSHNLQAQPPAAPPPPPLPSGITTLPTPPPPSPIEPTSQSNNIPTEPAYMQRLNFQELEHERVVRLLMPYWKRLAVIMRIPLNQCGHGPLHSDRYMSCKNLLWIAFHNQAPEIKNWHSILTELVPYLGADELNASLRSHIEYSEHGEYPFETFTQQQARLHSLQAHFGERIQEPPEPPPPPAIQSLHLPVIEPEEPHQPYALGDKTCMICFEPFGWRQSVACAIGCGHALCRTCVERLLKTLSPACPKCRKPFSKKSITQIK